MPEPTLPVSLEGLPRAWCFPSLPGVRDRDRWATYETFELDAQPRLDGADEELSWIVPAADAGEVTFATGEEGQQLQALTPAGLERVAGRFPLPRSLVALANAPDLQRGVRSVTACYLDLGDRLWPTSAPGAWLMHVVSDQQWCLHWLLFLDGSAHSPVLVSRRPYGFDIAEDEAGDLSPPEVAPLDGSGDLAICAYSFTEFLYRFWLENELSLALEGERQMDPLLDDYVRRLRQPNPL